MNRSSEQDIRESVALVVDDENATVQLITEILVEDGYENVHATTDPFRGPELYESLDPDIVLLDLSMPGLAGFEMMERFADVARPIRPPILVLTGHQDRETRLSALRSGAADFLTKPFDIAEVRQRVRNLLRVRLLTKELAVSHRRLTSVLDATGDAIAMFDTTGTLVFANRQYALLFELDEEATEASSAEELRREIKGRFQEPDSFERIDESSFASREGVSEDIVEHARPERRVLYRMTAPVTGTDGLAAGRILVYRDVLKELEVEAMRDEVARLRGELEREYSFGTMIGKSPAMQDVFDLVRQASKSDITVLVAGESGTGKELVAKGIHVESARRRAAFVPVNCAAIPESLIESELFGHEHGAFTGAIERRIGRFEQADGGTIFLDEIGEMPLALQPKLLRVLEDREVQRVGGTAAIKVDVRVIAATNRNLSADVEARMFRQDLYYRIAVFPIPLPPLCDRAEDIPLLAEKFLADAATRAEKAISHIAPDALRALMDHRWPGNVRELRNAMERAVVLESSSVLRLDSLPPDIQVTSDVVASPSPSESAHDGDAFVPLDEVERRCILDALERLGNDVGRAAEVLGVHRAPLYRKMKKYGWELPD